MGDSNNKRIFGEIALLTKLKRTATVQSDDYTNCAYLNKEDVEQIQLNFPHIAKQFKDKIKEYKDEKMNFKKFIMFKEQSNSSVNTIRELKKFTASSKSIEQTKAGALRPYWQLQFLHENVHSLTL